ncbi:hypothetical protein AB0E08_49935, partial [Streptomyces sp. NPDC048281]|uniref:hypothetical protein n=1 Tax=Streptomyces sp. NPDC048281 TaxID=3154715 RepID=UPI0034123041
MPERNNQGNKDRKSKGRPPSEVTDFLRNFLETPDLTMREFAHGQGVNHLTAYQWTRGLVKQEGRGGLSEDEQKELDRRLRSKGDTVRDAAYVTGFLREFLSTNMSMNQFAKAKEIPHTTAVRWASDSGNSEGRGGLSEDEQKELDKRIVNQHTRDAAYVTGFLREYLSTNMSMNQFAIAKGIPLATAAQWASGKRFPEGRGGLSKEEQKNLNDRRQASRSSKSGAQPGSFAYSGYQQDPAYGPPGPSQAGASASAADTYLVSGMPTTTHSQHQHQDYDQNYYQPAYPSAPHNWGQPTGPDSHQTAPARDASPTNA